MDYGPAAVRTRKNRFETWMAMTVSYSLHDLADLVDGEVIGNGNIKVSGLSSIDLAGPDDITFVTGGKMLSALAGSGAAASLIPPDTDAPALPCIRVANPDYAAAVIHNHFLASPFSGQGIHPTARIGADCLIPEEVSISPLACIGDRVRLGERVTVYPGAVIGDDCVIGDDTLLHANVTIGFHCVIGSRVILHSCAVIGADGFGFATDQAGNHLKKPQVGNVRIDDDVEIGANTCVDRATFGTTRIRRGTKIDDLCMIAHNVDIGENCILAGQAGIAGSTTLGRNVVVGGKAAISGHLHIGDRVMIAGMCGIHNDLPAGAIVGGGVPAFDIRKWRRAVAVFSKLPDIVKEMRFLRKEVVRLTELLEDSEGKSD